VKSSKSIALIKKNMQGEFARKQRQSQSSGHVPRIREMFSRKGLSRSGKRKELKTMPVKKETDSCRVCIRMVGLKGTPQQDQIVWMCPQCSETVDKLTGDLSIETWRFLTGNVL
jgi:hypothetical protein